MAQLIYIIEKSWERGLWFMWIYFKESLWFDLRFGTHTNMRIPKVHQHIQAAKMDRSDGLLYVASFTSVVREALAKTKMLLGEHQFYNSQFFDLGCGKGKALFVYARLFNKVLHHPSIGIEYDSHLVSVARENAQKLKLSDDVQIVLGSAVHLHDYLKTPFAIFYIYNSFQGQTLRKVLDQMSKVPHVLIYVDPVERVVLSDYGYNICHDHVGSYAADTWLIARSKHFGGLACDAA